MSEYGYDATAEQVREVLARAGHREYALDLPARHAGFEVTEHVTEGSAGAGVTVQLSMEAKPVERRVVFAGYVQTLVLAGFHVDYRGHYVYVHGRPKGAAV